MAGGTEQQLIELISRLDFEQYEVYVICLYSYRAKRNLHFLTQLSKLNISVINFDLDWSVKSKFRAIWLLICEIWNIRPQVVQAINYHSNLLIRLARPFLPALSLIGCIFVPYSPKQLWYERISNWLCNCIVCNSEALVNEIKQFAPHPNVIHIPNGVNLQKFSPLHIDDNFSQRVLLFMGRICQQKSPQFVVEALGKLAERGELPADIRLWIVGEREDEKISNYIDALVEKYSFENVVLRYGPTDIPEIFYNSAYVVVLPSLREGLPGVVLEALGTGRPVILSEAANQAGIVFENHNGWVFRTGDVEHLADVLSYALSLPYSTIQAMAPRCCNSVLAYDATHMVKNYDRLYESLDKRS
jgi:glycosyltransferase involved in cell wall biosynthesis